MPIDRHKEEAAVRNRALERCSEDVAGRDREACWLWVLIVVISPDVWGMQDVFDSMCSVEL